MASVGSDASSATVFGQSPRPPDRWLKYARLLMRRRTQGPRLRSVLRSSARISWYPQGVGPPPD
eukprot:1662350-Lingulodinium_polyedra.AAC.1